MLSVSERLSKSKKLNGLFNLPKSISALASCTTSVYVNLSKNSFFYSRFLESGCKGTTFFRIAKTFAEKFSSFMQNLILS